MDGGRPHDVIALDARNRGNEKLIAHLNIQIDYLQQKNRDLERRVEESRGVEAAARRQTADSEIKQSQLEAELRDVDRRAKRMEVDKETVVQVADKELHEANIELERSRGELESLDSSLARLRAENRRLEEEGEKARRATEARCGDVARMEMLMDRVQADKRKLSLKVTKLTANEKQLVLEMDRLKHRRPAVGKAHGKPRSPNRFDGLIKGLEEEREYWKGEAAILQDILKEAKGQRGSPISAVRRRSVSPVRGTPQKGRASRTASLHSTPKSEGRGRSPTKPGSVDRSAQYEAAIRALEEERDHYRREYQLQRSLKHSVESPRGLSKKGVNDSVCSSASSASPATGELRRVMRERDELQGLLDKFERHMAEIQANVKVLSGERDRVTRLYEEAREELQSARRQMLSSPKAPKSSLAAQTVLRRVEGERDEALGELRAAVGERDTLRERLRILSDQQVGERARLEQQLEDISQQFHSVTVDKSDLEKNVGHLRTRCSDLEEEVRLQGLRVSDVQEDAVKARSAASHTRMVADETERSLHDIQQRLMLKEGDVRNLQDRCASLDEKLRDAHRLNESFRDEITRLRETITSLDREKDALTVAADEKAERCVSLGNDLSENDRLITELKVKLAELDRQVERGRDGARLSEREIRSLRRQLDEATEESRGAGAAREAAVRDGRRLEEDLGGMTRENHTLHAELGEVLEERERLRGQVQDYVGEVQRVEHMLSTKEEERTDLLEQYRLISQQAERFESQSQQLEGETSTLRMELMAREADLRRLRDQKDGVERDVQEHVQAERALDAQIAQLNRAVVHLEERLRQSDAEKHTLQQDLMAVRDLCAKLESGKDQLHRHLTSKTLEQEQAAAAAEDARDELGHIKSQLGSERAAVNSLESLISSSREKEFQSQLEAQEISSEAQLMRDRLALNESKIESQSREISQLRSRNSELDADVERYRRQLTNERFERERAAQDAARHRGDNLTGSGGGTTGVLRHGGGSGYSSPSYSASVTPTKSPTRTGGVGAGVDVTVRSSAGGDLGGRTSSASVGADLAALTRQFVAGAGMGTGAGGYRLGGGDAGGSRVGGAGAGMAVGSRAGVGAMATDHSRSRLSSVSPPKSFSGSVTPLGSENSQWEEIETNGGQIMRRSSRDKMSSNEAISNPEYSSRIAGPQ